MEQSPIPGTWEHMAPTEGVHPQGVGESKPVIRAPSQTPLSRLSLTVSTACRFCKTKPGPSMSGNARDHGPPVKGCEGTKPGSSASQPCLFLLGSNLSSQRCSGSGDGSGPLGGGSCVPPGPHPGAAACLCPKGLATYLAALGPASGQAWSRHGL